MKKKLIIICISLCLFGIFSNVYGVTTTITGYDNNITSFNNIKTVEDVDKYMCESMGLSDDSIISYIVEKVLGFVGIFIISFFAVILFRFIVTIACKGVFGLIDFKRNLDKNKAIKEILIGINK